MNRLSCFQLTKTIIALCFSLVVLCLGAQFAHAATSVVLTVNGGSSVAIVNGQSVTLDWYVSGNFTSCSISNGVGVIDVTSLPSTPAVGSITVTPPANSSTSYELNCDGTTDTVIATIDPVVTVSIGGGATTLTIDPVTGRVEPTVQWTSQYATECSKLWFEKASNPSVKYYVSSVTNSRNADTYKVSGSVYYTGYPNTYITETSTFYITCSNSVTGGQTTGSVKLTVLAPPAPTPVTVDIYADNVSVTPDALLGYAYAKVHTRSTDVSTCSYSATYDNGAPYATLPPGYGQWGGHANGDFTARIATTTVFSVTCGRNALTVGTTTYPADYVTKSVRVSLTSDPFAVDRTLLPQVTASLVPIPATATSTIIDAFTGKSRIGFTVKVRNAEYCYLRAYDSSNNEYDLTGWTRVNSWNLLNGAGDYTIYTDSLAVTTRFEVECIRSFDANNYSLTSDEYANGHAVQSYTITTRSAEDAAVPPDLFMYINPYVVTAADILSTQTDNTGLVSETNFSTVFMRTAVGAATTKSITFPFAHPDGTYTVGFAHCDIPGGKSTIRFSSGSTGLFATHVTDKSDSDGDASTCNTGNYEYYEVATNVPLADGEDVTVSCDNADTTDPCRISELVFSTPSPVEVIPDPVTGFSNLDLYWATNNVQSCAGAVATPVTGSAYQYDYSGSVKGVANENIATTTAFELTCARVGDSQTVTTEASARFPVAGPMSSSVPVVAGECIDDGTFGDPGNTIDAPIGYMAGSSGTCVPSVDLAAGKPTISLAGSVPDAVNGTYNNIDVLIKILNYGPGGLLANSGVTYRTAVRIDPAITAIYPMSDIISTVGYFNNTLDIPTNPAYPTQSPNTLSRSFDGVPFGSHEVCTFVNLDGAPNLPESSLDVTNNTNCTNVTLPPPPPPMSLTAQNVVIRHDQTTTIDWSVQAGYQLSCTLEGPGGINQIFEVDATTVSGSAVTAPLTSAAFFVLQCTESVTSTVFSKTLRIDIEPESQEL